MVKYIRVVLFSIIAVFGIAMSLGSSYAYSDKGVYYDNVRYSDNVTFYGVDGLNLGFDAALADLGDSYEVIFDVVNDNDVDMVITDTTVKEDDPYITYELTYLDGKKVQVGDVLEKNNTKTLKYVVTYVNPVLVDNYQIDSSFNIQYDQKI